MRLRHAFLQTDHFVVGQTWSTFSDPEAEPIGIDFEGLNAISQFRQPQIRWTPAIRWRYQLALSLENPAPDLTGAEGVNLTPDFVVRLRWEPERKRELLTPFTPLTCRRRYSSDSCAARYPASDATLATSGIGGNISGVLVTRWAADDRIKFAANAGSGIGRYINDLRALGGQDAVFDPVRARFVRCPSRVRMSATSTPGRASSPPL